MLTAEHIHTTAAFGEINHLLPRDFARTHTNTFTLNAVIAP
jgi:hypothetical protein